MISIHKKIVLPHMKTHDCASDDGAILDAAKKRYRFIINGWDVQHEDTWNVLKNVLYF